MSLVSSYNLYPKPTIYTNPGPLVSWNDPSNPDAPQAGYGYIPNDTTKEETFFYHSDHLGSTSYITDNRANITQYDAYLPYGELLVDEHSSSEDLPYKFNGKQFGEETGMYYYGARYYEPRLSLWMSTDPLQEKYINISSYCYTFDNPIRFFDRNGEEGDVPQILYHNTKNAANVLKHGFNVSKYGKFSNYNWFSTMPNASGTGRAGKGITIGVKNIDVSNAVKISNRQLRGFYESAKSELGYTSEQLRNSPKLRAEVDRLNFQKLGQWMDANGASAYKVGNSYAVSDAVANRGIATSLGGSPTVIKALNGMKIAGRVLTVTAIVVDMYNIYSSHYSPRVITSVAGGWTGAWVGAKIGAEVGTGIGVWAGGVGEFIGAPLGGLIGGAAGYFTGRTVSETVYDKITQKGIPLGHR